MVIAIISILAALLLPALEGAIASARTAQCLSTNRQFAQGYMYVVEERQGFPTYSFGNGGIGSWFNHLDDADPEGVFHYMDAGRLVENEFREAFICPESDVHWKPSRALSPSGYHYIRWHTTSMNGTIHVNHTGWAVDEPRTFSSVMRKHPSQTAWWIEAHADLQPTYIVARHNYRHNVIYLDMHGATEGLLPGMVSGFFNCASTPSCDQYYRIARTDINNPEGWSVHSAFFNPWK